MFKLYKGKLGDLLKDKVTESFGFGTKKERMDQKLSEYRIQEINNINYVIAQRSILISQLNAQLSNYDRILNPMNEFLNLCIEIEDLAEKEITKDTSAVPFALKKRDGTTFATSNYSILREAIKMEKNVSEMQFLFNELNNMKAKNVNILVNKLDKGNGNTVTGLGKISNYHIYNDFQRLKQLMAMGLICYANGSPFVFPINDYRDALIIKNTLIGEINTLKNQRNVVEYNLNALKNASAADQNTLDLIEAAKKIVQTSPEYVAAKTSADYLNQFKR